MWISLVTETDPSPAAVWLRPMESPQAPSANPAGSEPESSPCVPSRAQAHPVRIWDLPTRLFHWSLASCVLGALVTGAQGGAALEWHLRFGQMILALLVFRIVWGVWGGRWSRFTHFQWTPQARQDAGHAFPGSWAVLGLLGLLALQVSTGLLADDEIATLGPLSALAPADWVRAATAWHKGWGEIAIWSIIGLHLSAITVYILRGRSLIEPMVGGDRLRADPVPPSRDDRKSRLLALAVILAALATAAWVFSLGSPGGFGGAGV